MLCVSCSSVRVWAGFFVIFCVLMSGHNPHVNAIFLQGKRSDDQTIDLHKTAGFGPKAGQYSVTGPLVISNPVDLCSSPPTPTNYTNAIVLAVRGNCAFSSKAFNAQSLGAVGIIIGNSPNTTERWIEMGSTPGLPSNVISIPSVYTLNSIYDNIVSEMIEKVNNNCTWTPTVPSSVYMCTLDSRGEYDIDMGSSSSFRLTALLLLVLPAVWIFVAVAYVARRYCSAQILRCKRQKKVKQLPVVVFRRGMLFNSDERALHSADPQTQAANNINANANANGTCHAGAEGNGAARENGVSVELSVIVNGHAIENDEKAETATRENNGKLDNVELTPNMLERSIADGKLLADDNEHPRSDRSSSITNSQGEGRDSSNSISDEHSPHHLPKRPLNSVAAPALRAPLRSQRFEEGESMRIHNDQCSICLTPDHQVLTRHGLKMIADVDIQDEVLSINPYRTLHNELSTHSQNTNEPPNPAYKHLEWKRVVATQKICMKCGGKQVRDSQTCSRCCELSTSRETSLLNSLYRVSGPSLDVIATADHRWLTFNPHTHTSSFVTTSSLNDRTQLVKAAGCLSVHIPLSGLDVTHADFRLPVQTSTDLTEMLEAQWSMKMKMKSTNGSWTLLEEEDHHRALLSIVGCILARGGIDVNHSGRIYVAHEKPETQAMILDLLDRAGAPFNAHVHEYRAKLNALKETVAAEKANDWRDELQVVDEQCYEFAHSAFYDFLAPMVVGQQVANAQEQRINGERSYDQRCLTAEYVSKYFSRLSSRQARALLYGMALGADSFQADSSDWHIITPSSRMRDDVMLMAVIAGAAVNYSQTESAQGWKVSLCFVSGADACGVKSADQFYKEKLSAEQMKPYVSHGFVYDLTVEDNHNFWVRRTMTQHCGEDIEMNKDMNLTIGGCFTGNCLEEFVDGTQIKVLPACLHAFHPQCIDAWLERSENCPVDRTSILLDERRRKRCLFC